MAVRFPIFAAMKNTAALLFMCLTLSACAVVDLAAHGVKEYERSRDPKSPPPDEEAPQQQVAPPPAVQRVQQEVVTEQTSVVPPRESVSVEGLK